MSSEEKDGSIYEFGCILICLDIPNWIKLSEDIKIEDIYRESDDRYGIEKYPHVTVLYGIHKDVDDEEVLQIFSKINKKGFVIEASGIDCFTNMDYDVLKMDLLSDELKLLNQVATQLPHTNLYGIYRPHVTIAYLNSGTGMKYLNSEYKLSITSIKKIIYSKTNGEKIIIPFN